MSPGAAAADLEAVFRRERGRLVALLARRFGLSRLPDAEDAVQAAMVAALRCWPFDGVPANPAAWLYRAAHRQMIDLHRRGLRFEQGDVAIEAELAPPDPPVAFDDELTDAELQLLFALCHPSLPLESQLVLALHSFGGLGLRELAAGLLTTEAALAQRLQRARQQLAKSAVALEVPVPDELAVRRSAVLKALYLIFNEGYQSAAGSAYQRDDLCSEALRLARLLADHPRIGDGEADALVALMLLHSARLASRIPEEGRPLLLHEQDRSRWDAGLIGLGLRYLDRARRSAALTSLHLQAAIAAEHATAAAAADTDWRRILDYYAMLSAMDRSPVARLGHAVAIAQVHGPAAGLIALEPLERDGEDSRSPFFSAARADMLGRLGRRDEAISACTAAIELARSPAERALLQQRLATLVISQSKCELTH